MPADAEATSPAMAREVMGSIVEQSMYSLGVEEEDEDGNGEVRMESNTERTCEGSGRLVIIIS